MNNLKGLLPRHLITDQALGSILKKTDEFKKTVTQSTEISTALLRIFEVYLHQLPRVMSRLIEGVDHSRPTFYGTLQQTYNDIYREYQKFILDYLQTPSSELSNANSMKIAGFCGSVIGFQQQMKNYSSLESSVFELVRKYFKNQKALLIAIQSYKQSFTQAKLIYNMPEKIKRYSICEQTYKAVAQDHAMIMEMKEKIVEAKREIISTFKALSQQMEGHQSQVNAKTFKFLSKFNYHLYENVKCRLAVAKKGRKQLQNAKEELFFENFSLDQSNQGDQTVPSGRRNASLTATSKQISNIENLKRICTRLQKYVQSKKTEHIKVFQFHQQYYKSIQKKCSSQLKESYSNFQKTRPKIKQQFLPVCYEQLKNTLRIIKSNMQVYTQAGKNIGNKIQNASDTIEDMKNTLRVLMLDVSAVVGKVTEECRDKELEKEQYKQKLILLATLIKSAETKLKPICSNIRRIYHEILNINQLSYADSYQRGSEIGLGSLSAYEEKAKRIMNEKVDRMLGTPFVELLEDENKCEIVFEDDIEKNNDFKKLKKPTEIQVVDSKQKDGVKEKQDDMDQCMNDAEEVEESPFKSKKKHIEFLQNKMNFVEGEQVIKTFSCALADKIILSGRLYVTSHRMCFFSKFNPSNVFFGQTFIQIPKKDIITLEKRKNGIFFDNSISLTTVKGQLFLTSFFKRNEAFDLMASLIGLKNKQEAYEQKNVVDSDISSMTQDEKSQRSQSQAKSEQSQISNQMDDDIKDMQISDRNQQIQKMLDEKSYPFKQLTSAYFNFKQLTAYKLANLLHLQGEVSINGTKHNNFINYFKQVILLHKDVQITSFEPALKQHLNPNTIKPTCPLKLTRVYQSTIPIPNSSIPFMPKTSKVVDSQSLYLISKHKWVLDSTIENSGPPYTDCFKVYLRTVCQSGVQGCKIWTGMYIHFHKSTMMRGVIESKSFEESVVQVKRQYQELRKYLVVQERLQRGRKVKKQGQNAQSIIEIVNNNQEIEAREQAAEEQSERVRELEGKLAEDQAKYAQRMESMERELKKYRMVIVMLAMGYFLGLVLSIM